MSDTILNQLALDITRLSKMKNGEFYIQSKIGEIFHAPSRYNLPYYWRLLAQDFVLRNHKNALASKIIQAARK